jgi:hypothetical protein
MRVIETTSPAPPALFDGMRSAALTTLLLLTSFVAPALAAES